MSKINKAPLAAAAVAAAKLLATEPAVAEEPLVIEAVTEVFSAENARGLKPLDGFSIQPSVTAKKGSWEVSVAAAHYTEGNGEVARGQLGGVFVQGKYKVLERNGFSLFAGGEAINYPAGRLDFSYDGGLFFDYTRDRSDPDAITVSGKALYDPEAGTGFYGETSLKAMVGPLRLSGTVGINDGYFRGESTSGYLRGQIGYPFQCAGYEIEPFASRTHGFSRKQPNRLNIGLSVSRKFEFDVRRRRNL